VAGGVPVGDCEVDLALEEGLVDADVSLDEVAQAGEVREDGVAAETGEVDAHEPDPAAEVEDCFAAEREGALLCEEVQRFGEDDGLRVAMGTALEVLAPGPRRRLLVSRMLMTLPGS
jgi:hypothetical protein